MKTIVKKQEGRMTSGLKDQMKGPIHEVTDETNDPPVNFESNQILETDEAHEIISENSSEIHAAQKYRSDKFNNKHIALHKPTLKLHIHSREGDA